MGSNGAVATTMMAGVALMRKGLVPKRGMVTEGRLGQQLSLAPLDNLVIGGWDLRAGNGYDAAVAHDVVPRPLLDQVKEELSAIKAWPAVASGRFLTSASG